jgi:hypothetical protein
MFKVKPVMTIMLLLAIFMSINLFDLCGGKILQTWLNLAFILRIINEMSI